MSYSIVQFNQEFSSEDVCLDTIFNYRYGDLKVCPKCHQETKFYRLKSVNRKAYSCLKCRHQLHPLAKTIFHKSDTPLTKWFFAMYLMSNGKNGTSALELSRHLNVTYKCAHRIAKKIRLLMTSGDFKLTGTVEVDETYVGGKSINSRTKKRTIGDKQVVFGMVERDGRVKAKHVKSSGARILLPEIVHNIDTTTKIYSDEWGSYKRLAKLGFNHSSVNHNQLEFARGEANTNTIEGFWSQLKRSINGTYHVVSPRYLQNYVDEFSFRYNLRTQPVFPVLLRRSSQPS